MKKIIFNLIVFYQHKISPYKGFCCAHSYYTGGVTCSEWGKRASTKVGLIKFLLIMVRRFKLCNKTYHENIALASESEDDNQQDKSDKKKNIEEGAACCITALPCLPT